MNKHVEFSENPFLFRYGPVPIWISRPDFYVDNTYRLIKIDVQGGNT